MSTWEDEAAFSEPGQGGDHQGLACGYGECETSGRQALQGWIIRVELVAGVLSQQECPQGT